MQKRTSYEFEGRVGYTYVTKAYGSNDLRFEVHFRANETDVDTAQFPIDDSSQNGFWRSHTRAYMENKGKQGFEALEEMYEEYAEQYKKSADSQE